MNVRTGSVAATAIVCGLLTLTGSAASASAQSCRAQQIMASQCTWFALEALRMDKGAAKQAETEATSTLVGGCSQGQYQMVLLRGTPLADKAVARLRNGARPDVGAVRKECAVQASRAAAR